MLFRSKEGNDLLEKASNLKIDPFFSAFGNPKIISYFKAACDAFCSDQPYNQAKADAYITLLFCEIAKLGVEKNLSDEVKRITRLINDNLYKTFSKEELVEASGISYKKLTTMFKNETGQTLHAYQISKKLEMVAMHIDTEPYVRMKELAANYNFYDEFYLSKLFKKKYGMSPQEYKTNSRSRRRKYDTIC